MNDYPKWPPTAPFPESQRDSTKDGSPDFPTSAGAREQGKFRPSSTPKLTQVAVTNDDGTVIGHAIVESNDEVVFWIKAMYAGLIAAGMAEDVTDGAVIDGL